MTRFTGRVMEHLTWEGHPAVVLDRTAFYPEGGGQPADQGTLQGVRVVDVRTRISDGAVVHLLEHPLDLPVGARVSGAVDWARRFDHMQQHTAQHILSQALLQVVGAETVGFHLGERSTTVDLDRGDLSPEDVTRAEALTNTIIEQNMPVHTRFVDESELTRLSLRRPPKVSGPIRLVEVVDFDIVPCGGTHVAQTGEIGVLAVMRRERYKGGTRLTFLAGRRARADYARRRQILAHLGDLLTSGDEDLIPRVKRLLQEHRTLSSEVRRLRQQALAEMANHVWEEAPLVGGVRLIDRVIDNLEAEAVRKLAGDLRARGRALVLLGWQGATRGRLVFVASPGVPVHMGTLLRAALADVGGRGGGRPDWAEGGVANPEDVASVVKVAHTRVMTLLQQEQTS